MLLVILGVVLYFLMIAAQETSSTYRITKGIATLMGLVVVAFFWNLWKGIDAIFEISYPTKFKGDVGINTD